MTAELGDYPARGACHGGAWVITRYRYPDGSTAEVHAHPQHGEEDAARARVLGYPAVDGVDAMTYDHDRLHTLLAWVLLKAPSPTLTGVARGEHLHEGIVAAEEAMVLAAQRFLNLVGTYGPARRKI